MTTKWRIAKGELDVSRTLVMGILNVTPDSFSDGGEFFSIDDALSRAEILINEGADIIDVGGESTRPSGAQVAVNEEIRRVVPVVEAIARRFNTPVSVDTSKSEVAAAAMSAGAGIINDISGLRFDPRIADVAVETGAGLVLMHSRGTFEAMHSGPPTSDILSDVLNDFRRSLAAASSAGVAEECIILDVGIGFGKTLEQNLELLAKLDTIAGEFPDFSFLVGTSRKSFIGKVLGDRPVGERLSGSLATAALAVWNGAQILRVHDVRQTVDAIRMIDAIRALR